MLQLESGGHSGESEEERGRLQERQAAKPGWTPARVHGEGPATANSPAVHQLGLTLCGQQPLNSQ